MSTNARKSALGRGLGALIEDASVAKEITYAVAADNEIEVNLIDVNPFQPRQDFDEEALGELSASIKQLGIIQPLTLRKLNNGRYQIIAGERRFRAAKLAGLNKVPAFIRSTDDQSMLELALVENIQRADLNAIEIAISYQRLIDECNLTQENLGDRVGKKRTTVTNYLRLLRLPVQIQKGLREEKLSMGHARALVAVENAEKQLGVFQRVITEGLSVRDVEELVRLMNEPATAKEPVKKSTFKPFDDNQEYEDLRHHLSKHFSTAVDFKRDIKGNGKIVINFKTDEELERILAVLDSKISV